MASTNHFPSGLNNWAESDKPSRADFVNDNAILDEHAMWKKDYDPEGAILRQGGLPTALAEIHADLESKANAYWRSTDEKCIGQGTDGKPLYEKTILLGDIFNNSSGYVPHGIIDAKKPRIVYGFFVAENNGTRPLPYPAYPNASSAILVYSDLLNIQFSVGPGWDGFATADAQVTVQYQKTTD